MSDPPRTVDAVVLGTGYVGLALAHAATGAGLSVVGFDRDPGVVTALNAGRSLVDDLSDDDIAGMLRAGFTATADPAAVASAAAAVICVPTPLTAGGQPDLRAVAAASRTVGRGLRRGMLVSLESTTYPGTTDEVVRPILEEESGLVAGVDFHLAFSPERVNPGSEQFDVRNIPKVVGGHTAACTERVAAFYGRFIQTVVPTRGTREAEAAKLLENTYRQVNIALVNEMSRFCHELDIDLWEVIRVAATKPFGFQAFHPGPGVGGHCIPIDPSYLSHRVRAKLGYPFRFAELADEINTAMPAYVARRAQDLLNDAGIAVNGASVLLLGVSYKPDVADHRCSPAVPLAQHLHALGAKVAYHDPHITDLDVPGVDLLRVDDLDGGVETADLVILVQPHRVYDADGLAATAVRFFDTQGVTTGADTHRL